MNLKSFDTRSYPNKLKKSKNLVRVSKRSGLFSFSSDAILAMGLTDGDKVEILQDEKMSRDFYVRKTESEFGFKLQRKHKNQVNNSMVFYAAGMIRYMLSELNIPNSATFKIAGESMKIENGMELFAIITASPIKPK